MVCNLATDANRIMTELMANEDDIVIQPIDVSNIKIPDFPEVSFDVPIQITNNDLTERKIDGCGTFDYLMSGMSAHIQREYEKGRITGNDYSKVYIAGIESALGNATQFLLGKDQAYWSAITAQQQSKLIQTQVVTAQVQLETAKVQLALAQYEALTARSNFALTKAKLATEEAEFCTLEYRLSDILPQEKENLIAQRDVMSAQIELVKEQTESQMAQTLDVRSDGQTVKGAIGKQKELQSEQIVSYKRDVEIKSARMWLDSWITQKTMDEGLVAPVQFTNATIDQVFGKLKTNTDL